MQESIPLTWEEVARVYGRKIYNFAYRLSGNPDDAADLTQEVLLRVRRGLALRAQLAFLVVGFVGGVQPAGSGKVIAFTPVRVNEPA